MNIFSLPLSFNHQATKLAEQIIKDEGIIHMSIIRNTAITTLAITTFAVTTISADAGRRHHRNIGLGILGGIAATAIIAGAANRNHYDDDYYDDRPVYRPRHRNSHVSWCFNRYRSYDRGSNTYISYGGRVRNCRSPYGR